MTPTVLASTFPLNTANPASRTTAPRRSWNQPHDVALCPRTASFPSGKVLLELMIHPRPWRILNPPAMTIRVPANVIQPTAALLGIRSDMLFPLLHHLVRSWWRASRGARRIFRSGVGPSGDPAGAHRQRKPVTTDGRTGR